MKTMRVLVLTAGAVMAAASVWAQGTDSFTGTTINSTNWPSSFSGTSGTITQNNQLLYSTTTSVGSDYAGLIWSGHPTYATSWSAQVDVLVPLLTLAAGQEYSAGIYIEGGTGSPSSNYNFSITLAPFFSGTTQTEFDSDLVTGGLTAVHPAAVSTASTSAALMVDYNAGTHVVTTYYDANGAVGGYNWTALLTWNIATGGSAPPNGATPGWGMSASDTFNIELIGTSMNFAITTGDGIGLDNFSTTVSAIPEPSTYAAIFGVLALTGAMFHRRRRLA